MPEMKFAFRHFLGVQLPGLIECYQQGRMRVIQGFGESSGSGAPSATLRALLAAKMQWVWLRLLPGGTFNSAVGVPRRWLLEGRGELR